MKKYRLKEEYIKLFTSISNEPQGTLYWKNRGLSIEALEEVEERIDTNLIIKDSISLAKQIVGHNCAYEGWTEQEREDIEKFLNLGGMIGLSKLWIEFCKQDLECSFMQLVADKLKEKGYESSN